MYFVYLSSYPAPPANGEFFLKIILKCIFICVFLKCRSLSSQTHTHRDKHTHTHTHTHTHIYIYSKAMNGPLISGCRIHRLHLCREVRFLWWMSILWHYTIWWWGSGNAGDLGSAEYHFIVITSLSNLARSDSTWQGPINGSNSTKLFIYAKLNSLKKNCFDI